MPDKAHSDYGGSVAERLVPGTNYVATDNGDILHIVNRKSRKFQIDRDGYATVCIRLNGRGRTMRVHRLVAKAWHGNCQEKLEVAHLDGDCRNNKPSNLKWVTRLENEQHKEIHGTRPRKITPEMIKEAKAVVWVHGGTKRLAAKFGVSRATIKVARNAP